MRHTAFIAGLMLLASAASAQQNYKRTHNKMLDDAKVLLAEEQYLEAAKIYRRLLPVDTGFVEVRYELAQCELNIPGNKDKAVLHLEKCVAAGHVEALYDLALLRHQAGRFDDELGLLSRYRAAFNRVHDDAAIDRQVATARVAREMVKNPVDVRIRNLGSFINSPAHDYCPLVTADGNTLYFTSRRDGSTGGMRDPSGSMFEDIYQARRVDEVWSNATNARIPLNSYVHDATVGLHPDGSAMIIYRTSPDMVSGDLFECKRSGTVWQNPVLMTERINSESHEPSASIAPSGNEIYFTSDRPGGHGGRDLYRIKRLPNGEWSLPLNLGPTVNTAEDEDAPFVHSDGLTLFFSSKGHGTMGGYDIFRTVLKDPDQNAWDEPENMGYPLNTVNDDIYFCLSDDGRTGYFSSEREGGMGGQDIHSVEFASHQLDYMVVKGLITDASDEPVKARITLTDLEGTDIVGVFNTNERTGRYIMVLEPGGEYRMVVEARGFDTRVSELKAQVADPDVREIPLEIQLVRNEHTARNAK